MTRSQITVSLWPRVELDGGVGRETLDQALNLLVLRSGQMKKVHFRCRCLPSLPPPKLDLLAQCGVTLVQSEDPNESTATVDTDKLVPLVRDLWENHIGFEGFTSPKSIHYYPAVSLVQMILEVFEIYW